MERDSGYPTKEKSSRVGRQNITYPAHVVLQVFQPPISHIYQITDGIILQQISVIMQLEKQSEGRTRPFNLARSCPGSWTIAIQKLFERVPVQ